MTNKKSLSMEERLEKYYITNINWELPPYTAQRQVIIRMLAVFGKETVNPFASELVLARLLPLNYEGCLRLYDAICKGLSREEKRDLLFGQKEIQ